MHVPVDKPVRIVIRSVDVLHSLFIPNFRVKMDAVPGRYTDLWFQATQVGEFPIFCAEYCGTSHSDMITRVVVHPPGGYEKWLEDMKRKSEDMPLIDLGKIVYEKQGCAVCHSVDGTPRIGPTWKGLFGKAETFAEMKAAYEKAKAGEPGLAGYERWFAQEPNNASLAAIGLYTDRVPAFRVLLQEQDDDLPRFYERIRTLAALPMREATA